MSIGTVKNIKGVKIGDRIIVHHYSGCRRCKHCATGWPQLCLNGENKTYGFNADGGNADYMVVLPEMCVPMPDGLSFGEGAAIACGTGTAYQALKRLRVNGTDTLAVFGQGPVGLSATLLGTFMGATVIAIDPDEKRLELAKNLLTKNGLIFISIDDNEMAKLKQLCDDPKKLFGEENFLAEIIWKNKFGSGAMNKGYISLHEYILCYSRNFEQIKKCC